MDIASIPYCEIRERFSHAFFLNRPEPEDVVSKGADLGLTPETRVAMSYRHAPHDELGISTEREGLH
jgi:hypothetical protein